MPTIVWPAMPQSFGQPPSPRYCPRSPWSIGSNTSAAMPFSASRAPIDWYSGCPLAGMAWPHGTITPGYGGLKSLGVGQEQQRRHVVLRLALEEDLLHAIARAGNRAGDLRLQRRSLRQAADGRQKLLPHLLLVGGDLLGSLSVFVVCLPPLECLPRIAHQEAMHHAARISSGNLLRRHVQVLPDHAGSITQKHQNRQEFTNPTFLGNGLAGHGGLGGELLFAALRRYHKCNR